MKYIYTWNTDTNMYDIRFATKDEQILIDDATKLLTKCKQIHNQIIEEANRLGGFNIVTIDSCEYLIGKQTHLHEGYGYFAHKGNCRFCKERRERKEIYESK